MNHNVLELAKERGWQFDASDKAFHRWLNGETRNAADEAIPKPYPRVLAYWREPGACSQPLWWYYNGGRFHSGGLSTLGHLLEAWRDADGNAHVQTDQEAVELIEAIKKSCEGIDRQKLEYAFYCPIAK